MRCLNLMIDIKIVYKNRNYLLLICFEKVFDIFCSVIILWLLVASAYDLCLAQFPRIITIVNIFLHISNILMICSRK